MSTTNRLTKALLSTSLAAALSLASATVIAQEDAQLKTYTDPVSGELKVAPKLLSEMTEQEIAELSDEEKKYLSEIEALVDSQRQGGTEEAVGE